MRRSVTICEDKGSEIVAAADLAGSRGVRASTFTYKRNLRDAHVLLAVSCNTTVSLHPTFTLMHRHESRVALFT